MKIIHLMTVLLFSAQSVYGACDCGSVDPLNPCRGTSITVEVVANPTTRNQTFTWNFNSAGGEATCGQFANGDYWVAPALDQSSVTITSVTGTQPELITVDADPAPYNYGLLDGTPNYHGFNSFEILSFPKTYSAITSLVAAKQRDEVTAPTYDGNKTACLAEGYDYSDEWSTCTNRCGTPSIEGSCVDFYHVVTVMPSVPEKCGSETIRPNITGQTKEILTLDDFDFSRLPSKSYLTGTDAAGLESIRQRWSHNSEIFSLAWFVGDVGDYNGEAGRQHRAHELVLNYSAGTSSRLHEDIATLFSDDNTIPEKTEAIAAILSYGLDLYHGMYDQPTTYRMSWESGAGQHLGKFSPVVFLAALEVGNQARQTQIKANGSVTNYYQPQELAQLHVGVNGPVWGDDQGITGYWWDYSSAGCYDGSLISCNIAVGKRTAADPHKLIDGPANKPGSNYFGIGYAGILNFAATMLVWPEFYGLVNSTKPIDFVNRARTHGLQTLPDPCVNRDTREEYDCSVRLGGVGCDYYYPAAGSAQTWGPKSLTDYSAGCVDVETSPYTTAGRFASLDGTTAPITGSYLSSSFYSNWDTIYAEFLAGQPEPTCSDLTQNGDETGVDCGGSCPNPCEDSPPATGPRNGRIKFGSIPVRFQASE